MDTEPVVMQSTQADWGGSHQEEPSKRRRPVRKRKRRPLPNPEEDLIPQERQVYHEEYRPYQHEKFNPQAGIIRRRRKQFDSRQTERPSTWTDETVDPDRPLVRKRGHKRKRPSTEDTWHELSEFNAYRPYDNTEKMNYQAYIQPTEPVPFEDNHNYYNTGELSLQNDDTVIKSKSEERDPPRNHDANYKNEYIANSETDNNSGNIKDENDDKSLSEFSLEINPIQSPSEEMIDAQEKLSEKSVNTFSKGEKAESNEPMAPQTLKEVLKKSNGRSLSEILQQHNLSLVDLLHGKEKAISILKMEHSSANSSVIVTDNSNENSTINNATTAVKTENKRFQNRNIEQKPNESIRNTIIIKNVVNEIITSSTPTLDMTKSITEQMTTTSQYSELENSNEAEKSPEQQSNQENAEIIETTPKSLLRRRFPVGIRRKLRMKPGNNTVYKSQLSRDLIALTSRRYQLSRNTSRSREWKDVMPTMVKVNTKESEKILANEITTTSIPEETTVQNSLFDETKSSTIADVTDIDPSTINVESDSTSTEPIQTITFDVTITEKNPTTTSTATTSTTEKPINKAVSRPVVKASDLRRQAFNNRLKRKRLKQKTTTTEATQDYAMKDVFGMANLVSASEFIAKVKLGTTNSDEEQDFTTLEDFMTTESSNKVQTKSKTTKIPKIKYSTTHAILLPDTEETAKIEIEEILNDTRTSARLSKILMERNMTINELVEHRERGSSHIHLADIFHNASREPNPPEPFLSKSLIEPISKETYPLRALLEANLHDPAAKATTIDPNSTQLHYLNIPVVMDFGNNVNENGENMGIMSLFNNFTKIKKLDTDTNEFQEQSIETSSHAPKDSDNNQHATSRESRILNTDRDLVTWKEIIAIMHRGQNNDTNEVVELTTKEISPSQAIKKIMLDDDLDSNDGLIVLNDLQKDFDSHAASDENFLIHSQEKAEFPPLHSNPRSNSAKSVTVATASIIGLAMVLFLLTYATFKWKQQRSLFREKQSLRRDRIPTPVFENRKSHKNNSSTRSKSPMISSSNIYTIDTLDMRNGGDSPEYMWDSLRKPFQ